MRKLIRADIGRILRKANVWIVLAIILAITAFTVLRGIREAPDVDFAFAVHAYEGLGYAGIFTGLLLVLNIYRDDFRSMVFVNVIGRGISRRKLILARFIETLLLLLAIYAAGGILITVLKFVTGASLTADMVLYIVLGCFGDILITSTGIAAAAVIFYLTGNTALGVLGFITADVLIPVALSMINTIPIVARLHLERLYFNGLAFSIMSDFMIGSRAAGILKLLCYAGVYLAGLVLVSFLVFRKKELDF